MAGAFWVAPPMLPDWNMIAIVFTVGLALVCVIIACFIIFSIFSRPRI
jgi:hypothetical protein